MDEESLWKALLQKSRNIARSLCHGHNLNQLRCVVICGAIDNQVRANRPEQNRVSGQVLAFMTDAGRFANGLKRVEQLVDPSVGGVKIVLGDIVLYAIQVAVGILAQDVTRHASVFRLCSDLRLSRARASAGETCWPRSSVSRRRLSS